MLSELMTLVVHVRLPLPSLFCHHSSACDLCCQRSRAFPCHSCAPNIQPILDTQQPTSVPKWVSTPRLWARLRWAMSWCQLMSALGALEKRKKMASPRPLISLGFFPHAETLQFCPPLLCIQAAHLQILPPKWWFLDPCRPCPVDPLAHSSHTWYLFGNLPTDQSTEVCVKVARSKKAAVNSHKQPAMN